MMAGDSALAIELLRRKLTMCQELRDRRGMLVALEDLAEISSTRGQARRAARLLGACEAFRDAHGGSRVIGVSSHVARGTRNQQRLEAVRASLTPADFELAWAEGQSMSSDEAVAFALDTD
jgi:hypothetical protein